jgi:hypothetical protein
MVRPLKRKKKKRTQNGLNLILKRQLVASSEEVLKTRVSSERKSNKKKRGRLKLGMLASADPTYETHQIKKKMNLIEWYGNKKNRL